MPPIFDLSQILEPRHEVLGDVNLQRHPREVGDSSHAKGPQAAGGGLRSRLQPGFHVPLAPVLTVGVGHSSPPSSPSTATGKRDSICFSRAGDTLRP